MSFRHPIYPTSLHQNSDTVWLRRIQSPNVHVTLCELATMYRAFLRKTTHQKMTYKKTKYKKINYEKKHPVCLTIEGALLIEGDVHVTYIFRHCIGLGHTRPTGCFIGHLGCFIIYRVLLRKMTYKMKHPVGLTSIYRTSGHICPVSLQRVENIAVLYFHNIQQVYPAIRHICAILYPQSYIRNHISIYEYINININIYMYT